MENDRPAYFLVFKYFLGMALLSYCSVCMYSGAVSHVDSYDASYIASVGKHFAFDGRYGVWDYQTFVDWPVEVTTGPTVIIPIAIGYMILGDGPFVPNLSTATLVTILLAIALGLLLKSVRSWTSLGSLGLGLFLLLCIFVKPFNAFYIPLGEVSAALCLVIATLLTFDSKDRSPSAWRLALAGAFAASAVYAKFLSVVPVFTLVAYQMFLIWRREWQWRYLIQWCIGYAAIVLGWEVFRLATLGSLSAYINNTSQFLQFVKAPGKGAGYSVFKGPSLWHKIQTHGSALFTWTGLLAFALPLPLFVLPWLIAKREPQSNARKVAAAFGLQAALVGFWWFFLSDLDWIRHLLIGLFVWPFFGHYIFTLLLESERPRTWRQITVLSCCLLVIGLVYASPPGRIEIPKRVAHVDARTQLLFDFVEKFKAHRQAHPDARYWTAGWWRHWDVQILTGARFHNLLQPQELEADKNFLVTSDVFNWEKHSAVGEIQNASEQRKQIEIGPFKVSELATRFEYGPPVIAEFSPTTLTSKKRLILAVHTRDSTSPYTVIRCNNRLLRTDSNPERTFFTAKVGRDLLSEGELRFELFDPFTGIASEPSYVKSEHPEVIARSASESVTR